MRNGISALPWFGLALVIILLDQYTKGLASSGLEYGQPVRVFWWLNFTLQHNAGAAFSFLSDAGGCGAHPRGALRSGARADARACCAC